MAAFATPTLASETIFHIGTFDVRNTLLMAWLAMLFLLVIALATRMTGYKKLPGRFQTLMEIGVEGLYNFFGSVIQDAKQTRLFFPLLATILIFVVTGNWMGIFPGVGSVTIKGMHEGHEMMIPLFRSMNADVNMTLAIALISMISVQVFGIGALGFKHYAGKFFVPPWKDPVGTFVGLLELIGEFSKVISFSFRLFGNVFAGEVLLVVIAYLVPYIAPVPFLAMEIFVGLVQGLVFSLLTAVFLKIGATAHESHEEAHA
ncbi:F0F1 ATP synthase subunit A [Candidatus Peribacteria bacterium]|nr:MAG: F0F1 ATP synthase subunit A [Candidatus Peribacteria bacterium]